MKQVDVREGARRQHRTIAFFGVIQAWLRQLDGLVFEREHLERLLGIEKFTRSRVEWLCEDVAEFFPFQQRYLTSNKRDLKGELNSFNSLWVSRKELPPHLTEGAIRTEIRIASIPDDGPRIGVFKMWPPPKTFFLARVEGMIPFLDDAINFDERLLSSYLALLSQGQISPRSLPSLRDDD